MGQGKIVGSYNISMKTVFLIRKLVATSRWTNAKELIELIKSVGKDVIQSEPSEPTVGNMVRRVLKFVREEYSGTVGDEHEGESLQSTLMAKKTDEKKDFTLPASNLKSAIMDSI